MPKRRGCGNGFRIAALVVLFAVLFLIQYSFQNFDPAGAFYDEDEKPMEYVIYHWYDPEELALQIKRYKVYCEQNDVWLDESADDIEKYGFRLIPEGDYVVGENIEPGKYYVQGIDSAVGIATLWVERNGFSSYYPLTGVTQSDHRYIWLNQSDKLTVSSEEVYLADAAVRPPIAPRNGVYPEAAYAIGTDIPAGEYFAVQVNDYSAEVETCGGIQDINRFGYVRLKEEDVYVQFSNCVLMPADQKPAITPLTIDGKVYYGQGMYKIGEDIPVGTYTLHPDLFLYNKSRETFDYRLTEQYNWLGYMLYDKETTLTAEWELGLQSYRDALRTKTDEGEWVYNVPDGKANVTLDQPGEYIELTKIRLSSR